MVLAPLILSRRSHAPRADEPMWVDEALLTPMPSPVEALRSPDAAAAAVAALPPAPDSWHALLAMHPAAMSDAGLIDALTATEKVAASVAALQQRFLAEVARRDPIGGSSPQPGEPGDASFLRDEAACALKVAPGTAQQRLEDAAQLTGRLSDTLDLQEAGRLSSMNARILARGVAPLSDEVAAKVQDRALTRGCSQTPGEFRATVRRVVARLDHKDDTERHREAFAHRKVISFPTDDHMAEVRLHLAADGAAVVMRAIDVWAVKTDADDTRTADQRRADAIVDICSHALVLPGLPRQHGIKPAITVTVAASTLTGRDEQPAHLDGYGPIPADMARRLANLPGATRHHVAVDTDGRVLDLAVPAPARAYTPPVRIARHVIIRDQHCVMPGCRRRATNSELDHRIPWPTGPTSVQNLQPLCKRHHDLKHRSRWRVERCPDGSYHWTSPTRHTYRYRPPELPVPELPVPEPPPATSPIDDLPPPF
jgi:hypothetical protein